MQISTTQSFSNPAASIAILQDTMTEYVLDVSNLNASYYITVVTTSDFNLGFEIEAIWLE